MVLAQGRYWEQPMDLNFSALTPIVLPVRYRGQSYALVEASEGAAVSWRNAMFSKARYVGDGKYSGPGDIADGEPLLVSMCLYRLADTPGENSSPVMLEG